MPFGMQSIEFLGKLFTVKTDHKNIVYLANSSIPKLVRWRVLLSEFRILIQHIPGVQNVVADGLTRVMSLSSVEILKSKRRWFVEDRILRNFRLEGERSVLWKRRIGKSIHYRYSGQHFQTSWAISGEKHNFEGVRASSEGVNFRGS